MGEGKDHKAMKKAIVDTLVERGYRTQEEAHVTSVRGGHSNQRADILAWNPETEKAFVIELYTLNKEGYDSIVKKIERWEETHPRKEEIEGLRIILKRKRLRMKATKEGGGA